jgi:hypothetical protein
MAIIESIPIEDNKLTFPRHAAGGYHFHNTQRTAINPRIQLVSGKDVSATYRNTHAASVHSCMKGSDTNFYDSVQSLRMIRIISDDLKDENDKFIVHLRSLVWKVKFLRKNEITWYIDRVYSNTAWAMKTFNRHWKKWGKLRYGTNLGTLVSKMKSTDILFETDTDTFEFINRKRREITNAGGIGDTWTDAKEIPPKWHPSDDVFSIYDV